MTHFSMTGMITTSPAAEQRGFTGVSRAAVAGLLDTLDTALALAERGGRIVLINERARKCLVLDVGAEAAEINLFQDILGVEAAQIFARLKEANVK